MSDGSRHSLFMVPEVTSGETPASPALETVRVTKVTLGLAKDSLESAEIRSDRMIADFRLGANQVNGDIEFELSYGSFDKLLQAALMSAPWAGTPAAIKAGTARQSFTFVRKFADLTAAQKPFYIYRGVEINTLQLKIAANAMITGTMSVVGRSMETKGDLTELVTPTFPAVGKNPPLDSFTGTLKEGGTTIAVITEISLSLTNGIAPRFVVGSKDGITPSSQRSKLTGSITAFFEDSTLVDKFVNETESSIELALPDGTNTLKVLLPRIKYTGGQPDVAGEGPIMLTMPFQALLDTTTGTNIVITR